MSELLQDNLDFEGDALAAIPNERAVATIRELAQKLGILKKRIATGKALLAELEREEADIEKRELPKAMEAAGTNNIGLLDGTSVESETKYVGHIPALDTCRKDINAMNRRMAAFDWLRDNGAGDLLKNEVTIQLAKGQDNLLPDLLKAIGGLGLSASTEESVHWSTLNKYVGDRAKKNLPLPSELGAHALTVAKVIPKKGN